MCLFFVGFSMNIDPSAMGNTGYNTSFVTTEAYHNKDDMTGSTGACVLFHPYAACTTGDLVTHVYAGAKITTIVAQKLPPFNADPMLPARVVARFIDETTGCTNLHAMLDMIREQVNKQLCVTESCWLDNDPIAVIAIQEFFCTRHIEEFPQYIEFLLLCGTTVALSAWWQRSMFFMWSNTQHYVLDTNKMLAYTHFRDFWLHYIHSILMDGIHTVTLFVAPPNHSKTKVAIKWIQGLAVPGLQAVGTRFSKGWCLMYNAAILVLLLYTNVALQFGCKLVKDSICELAHYIPLLTDNNIVTHQEWNEAAAHQGIQSLVNGMHKRDKWVVIMCWESLPNALDAFKKAGVTVAHCIISEAAAAHNVIRQNGPVRKAARDLIGMTGIFAEGASNVTNMFAFLNQESPP